MQMWEKTIKRESIRREWRDKGICDMKTGDGHQQRPDAREACQPAEATSLSVAVLAHDQPRTHRVWLQLWSQPPLVCDTPRARCRQQLCATADRSGNSLHTRVPPRERDTKSERPPSLKLGSAAEVASLSPPDVPLALMKDRACVCVGVEGADRANSRTAARGGGCGGRGA